MLEINLLPYREEKKKKEKRKFCFYLLALISFLLFFVNQTEYYFQILKEKEYKNYNLLKEKLNDVENIFQKNKINDDVEKNKKLILRKIKKERYYTKKIIRLFFDLIEIIPHHVFLERIKKENQKIILSGYFMHDKNLLIFLNNLQNKFKKIEVIEFKKKNIKNKNNFIFGFSLLEKIYKN